MSVEPVSYDENRAVGGKALCGEGVWKDDLAQIEQLRARQAAYRESLPQDDSAAISAAWQHLSPRGESYPDGFERALYTAYAIEVIVRTDAAQEGFGLEAAAFLAESVTDDLRRVQRSLDRVSDILGNPARIEQNAKQIERLRKG
ncbi:MAG: hypothetical protein ACK4RN_06410 [Pseudorhodobacter sp.]